MRPWMIVAGLAVLLVVVYVWLSPGQMPQLPAAATSTSPPPGEPVAAPSAPGEPSETQPAAQAPAQPSAEPQAPFPQLGPVVHNPVVLFKSTFDSETRDALWADAKEEEIRGVLSDEALPEDLVRSASCRRTVCRVELQWTPADTSGYHRLSELVGEHWAPNVGLDYPENSREDHRLDLYIMREGYQLSDMQ